MNGAPALGLCDLTDATLERAIHEHARLIADNPAMEEYLGTALRQHQAERERRTKGANSEASEASEPPEAPEAATPSDDDDQYAYESPVLVPEKARLTASAERRVRFAPSRYAEEAAALVKRPPTRAEKEQHDANQTMREQLRQNAEIIRKRAEEFSCPLLRAAKQAKGVHPNDSLAYLMDTQMQQVAVASDGHQYDFAALREYIKKGMSVRGGPVSPITKQPISVEVRYAPKKRDPKTGVAIDNARVTKVWRPNMDCNASRAARA